MNYFFISAAFFAFHLLLAYLVDHHLAARRLLVAAAVSAWRSSPATCGSWRAWADRLWPAAAAQAVYLVAFSYAFFFEGLTGLAVTIGAVITLFVLMQTTAARQLGRSLCLA